MSDRAAEYRKRADECRIRAYEARDPKMHAEFLRQSEDWLQLALHVERRQRGLIGDWE
jgi:hypothetical protein